MLSSGLFQRNEGLGEGIHGLFKVHLEGIETFLRMRVLIGALLMVLGMCGWAMLQLAVSGCHHRVDLLRAHAACSLAHERSTFRRPLTSTLSPSNLVSINWDWQFL